MSEVDLSLPLMTGLLSSEVSEESLLFMEGLNSLSLIKDIFPTVFRAKEIQLV